MVFSGKCWAPLGPTLQHRCCSNPGEQKGEGKTNRLTLCGRNVIIPWSDGTVRVEQKGKGNLWYHIKVSMWNKPYERTTHSKAFFSFSRKREVLRSTLALSRQIDWITHKKTTPFVRFSVTNLEGQGGDNSQTVFVLTASSFATLSFFRMANRENNVVTLTGVGNSTTLITAVVLSNRYQYFSSKHKMEFFRPKSSVALLILPS